MQDATKSVRRRVVLIAELDTSDIPGEVMEDVVQAKLDSFREAVLPSQYGVMLYRATERDVADFLGERLLDPAPRFIPATDVTQ